LSLTETAERPRATWFGASAPGFRGPRHTGAPGWRRSRWASR